MDSVTQFALGACVGVAVLGRKIGPERAAITGGVLGTLPDLDVYLAPDDPIDSFVQHRGWSHSLFLHAALTPLLGEAIRRLFEPLRSDRGLTWAAVFLCLSTHALLDAVTIYGTRLFWPISTDPVSVGALFIINPLYTLPLLVAMVWAFIVRRWTPRFRKALAWCLGLSTAYLGWSLIAQQVMTGRAEALLAGKDIAPDRLIAMPTPFNTLFWRVIAVAGDRSFNLYMPVFGGQDRAILYAYDRHLRLEPCASDDPRVSKIARFSKGFYKLMIQDGEVMVADLRMGLTPNYAFRFSLGRLQDGKIVPGPTRRVEGRGDIDQDLDWLLANLRGTPAMRLAEADAIVGPVRLAAVADARPKRAC